MSGSAFSLKTLGLQELANLYGDTRIAFSNAREYALASTAKLIRTNAQNAGLSYKSAFGLGWPRLSPFTGTIAKNKGAKRGAFSFAKKAIRDYGTSGVKDVFINRTAINSDEDGNVSRSMLSALKRQLRIQKSSGRKKSKNDLYKSWWKKHTGNARPDNKKENPLQRLAGFVRSRIDPNSERVTIGFFGNVGDTTPDSRLEELVSKQARGFTTTLTSKMRRFFFAIGFPTSQNSFVTPPRPWFGPVYARLKDQIPTHFSEKFMSRFRPFLRGMKGSLAGLGAND